MSCDKKVTSDLRQKLTALSASEIQSLLIEVYRERAALITSSSLSKAWRQDRFVQSCAISPRDFINLDSAAFDAAADFVPLELSPVCPLGTNSAIAHVSQNKVLGTIRNTEVVADSTNVMALECAVRRRQLLKANPKNASDVKFCASHRLIRTQIFNFPGATAHFRVFSLCTAGRDTGSFEFEGKAMADHISVYIRLFQVLSNRGFRFGDISIGLYGGDTYLTSRLIDCLHKGMEGIPIELLGNRGTAYYPTASFVLKIQNKNGEQVMIGDGGFTDWTQKLVQSSKERLMISGIGTDRLISQFKCDQERNSTHDNG
ncbi:MAG: hypothetical protein AB7G93_22660 [Bdellovibrionales bacterium]